MSLGYLTALGRLGATASPDVTGAIAALREFAAYAPSARAIPAANMSGYEKAWAILADYTKCGCGGFPAMSGATKDAAIAAASQLAARAEAQANAPAPPIDVTAQPGNPGVFTEAPQPSVSSGQTAQVNISPNAPADSTFLKPATKPGPSIPSWVWIVVGVGVVAYLVGDDTAVVA